MMTNFHAYDITRFYFSHGGHNGIFFFGLFQLMYTTWMLLKVWAMSNHSAKDTNFSTLHSLVKYIFFL